MFQCRALWKRIIVRTYETYCVPDRTITDNISFIRYVTDVCTSYNYANFAFGCLDLEEAFDCGDRSYFLFLHSGLLVLVMDFWLGFVCRIAVLSVESPWAVRIYTLAMEPLLCRLGDHQRGLQILIIHLHLLSLCGPCLCFYSRPGRCSVFAGHPVLVWKRSHLNGLTGQKNEALLEGIEGSGSALSVWRTWVRERCVERAGVKDKVCVCGCLNGDGCYPSCHIVHSSGYR